MKSNLEETERAREKEIFFDYVTRFHILPETEANGNVVKELLEFVGWIRPGVE